MLSIFRSNQLLTSVLLLLYAAVLHSRLWISPEFVISFPEGGILYQLLVTHLGVHSFWVGIGGVIGLFLTAFLLNFVEFSYRLDRESHLFPGIFLILFSAYDPSFVVWSPIHLANIFLLVAVYLMMGLGRKTVSKGALLNIGIFIGLSALFYPAYLLLLLFGGVALYVQRGFSGLEFLIIALGAALVFYLTGGVCYLFDSWDAFLGSQGLKAYSWLDIRPDDGHLPFGLLVWGVLLLVMLFQYAVFTQKRNMQSQRRIAILFWLLLFSITTLPLQKNLGTEQALVAALPIAYLSGIWFYNLKKNWSELLHFLLFLVALAIQWYPSVAPLLFGEGIQK